MIRSKFILGITTLLIGGALISACATPFFEQQQHAELREEFEIEPTETTWEARPRHLRMAVTSDLHAQSFPNCSPICQALLLSGEVETFGTVLADIESLKRFGQRGPVDYRLTTAPGCKSVDIRIATAALQSASANSICIETVKLGAKPGIIVLSVDDMPETWDARRDIKGGGKPQAQRIILSRSTDTGFEEIYREQRISGAPRKLPLTPQLQSCLNELDLICGRWRWARETVGLPPLQPLEILETRLGYSPEALAPSAILYNRDRASILDNAYAIAQRLGGRAPDEVELAALKSWITSVDYKADLTPREIEIAQIMLRNTNIEFKRYGILISKIADPSKELARTELLPDVVSFLERGGSIKGGPEVLDALSEETLAPYADRLWRRVEAWQETGEPFLLPLAVKLGPNPTQLLSNAAKTDHKVAKEVIRAACIAPTAREAEVLPALLDALETFDLKMQKRAEPNDYGAYIRGILILESIGALEQAKAAEAAIPGWTHFQPGSYGYETPEAAAETLRAQLAKWRANFVRPISCQG